MALFSQSPNEWVTFMVKPSKNENSNKVFIQIRRKKRRKKNSNFKTNWQT